MWIANPGAPTWFVRAEGSQEPVLYQRQVSLKTSVHSAPSCPPEGPGPLRGDRVELVSSHLAPAPRATPGDSRVRSEPPRREAAPGRIPR